MEKIKRLILQKLKRLHLLSKAEFIMLFGSASKKQTTPLSDIDVCISFNLPAKERLTARMKLLGELPEKYDIQIFEDLPLYVQKEVLTGKLLYCKNKTKLINRALRIIKEYEEFEPVYNLYVQRDLVTA